MVSRLKKDRLRKGNLFIPLIFSFGAALEGMALAEFLEDPTKISNTLRLIQNYFQVDGLITYADNTVLAETLGSPIDKSSYPPTVVPFNQWQENLESRLNKLDQVGRIAIALEVTKRLSLMLPEAVLIGLVTGPLTLACQLSGENSSSLLSQPDVLVSASKASLAFAKAFANAGIDILVVWEEDMPLLTEDRVKLLGRCYSPIWNTARFYDISPLLMTQKCEQESIDRLRKFVDGFIFSSDSGPNQWNKFKRRSFALPVALIEKEREEIDSFLSSSGVKDSLESSQLFLVTTESEIHQNVNKEFMIRGIETIRDFMKRAD